MRFGLKAIIRFFFVMQIWSFSQGCGDAPISENKINDTTDARLSALNDEIKAHPQKAELYYQRARYYSNKERYFESLDDIRQSIALDSLNPLYHFAGGEILFKVNQSKRAVEAFKIATKLKPDFANAWEKLGELYLIVKEYDSSELCWKKLSDIDKTNPRAPVFRGIMFMEKGDTVRAIRSFQYALEVDPANEMAMIQLGQIYAGQGNAACLPYYESLIRQNPRSWEAYLFRSHYYLMIGNYEKSIKDIDQTLSLNSNAYLANYYAGFIFYLKGKYQPAIEQFGEVIRKKENYLHAYYSRALCYIKLGQPNQAMRDLDELLTQDPNFEAAVMLKKTIKKS